MTSRHDFGRQAACETWYDPDYDRVLIEQSIVKQYGILPSAQGDLQYSDWAKMVGGLMEDTPLGKVVAIRSERDTTVKRQWLPAAKKIYSDWQAWRLRHPLRTGDTNAGLVALQMMTAAMCGKEVTI